MRNPLSQPFLLAYLFIVFLPPTALAVDYHIDSADGDDTAGDGSVSSPWKSLSQLATVALGAGDQILLKRGSVFRESLDISVSGADGNPIVVDAYGEGAVTRNQWSPLDPAIRDGLEMAMTLN